MEIWIAAGDETGNWDIVDGRFSGHVGLAWVLGPLAAWERALQQPLGGGTALEAFAKPLAARLPEGVRLPSPSRKYHVMDIWSYCRKAGLERPVALDAVDADPVLELLRGDAAWLLARSGLGVLAAGGAAADGKAAGIGLSGDGLRERARAFAGLMTVALPFIPGGDSINLLVEGRLESTIADAARFNRFSETSGDKYLEPYRSFVGYLKEDLAGAAERCESVVAGGAVGGEVHCNGRGPLAKFLAEKARGVPFLKANADDAVNAMNGIADLAAALVPQPGDAPGCRLAVPEALAANLWTGNFRELKHAIRG